MGGFCASWLALAGMLLGVPRVHQTTSYTCGAAAVGSVAGYYGRSFTEMAVAHAVGTDSTWGTCPTQMKRFLDGVGVPSTMRVGMTVAELREAIRAGRPAILLLQAWPPGEVAPPQPYRQTWDLGHYVVAVGIDAENVYLMDPALEEERGYIPLAELEARWHGYGDDGEAQGLAIVPDAAPAVPPSGDVRAGWWRVP